MSKPPEVDLLEVESFPQIEARAAESWVRLLVHSLAPEAGSLAVRFVEDSEMRSLNLRYRNRDATTDVLSFAGAETPEGRHLGDVVISVPFAMRQAKQRQRGLAAELQTLLLHGTLHCLGYDHDTDGGEMERREQELRPRWVCEDGSWLAPVEGDS